jgi:transcriptional regulator with XRE-family HTH domain
LYSQLNIFLLCFSGKEGTMEKFAERVIAERETQGWTRRELAKQAGLHEQHLAKVERGQRHRIEADTIIKLARALDCSADYLMGLTDDPTPPTKRPRSREAAPVG